MRGSISLIRQRPSETSTSGGRSDTDRNALAVMPWIVSRWVVVTTVTPVAKRPMTLRSSRAAASAAAERGVSLATPVGAVSVAPAGGVGACLGAAGERAVLDGTARMGGIMPVESVGGATFATRVRRATPSPIASRPRALLLRVIEGESYDGGGDPFLQPVELADLDRGPDLRVLDRHAAERDGLAQQSGCACRW